MTEAEGALRHLAFFEALGGMDESDPSWRTVSAGLVVMRLVDRWLADGRAGITTHNVSGVRSAIEEVPVTTPIRAILGSIVDSVTSAEPGQMESVTPRLMAYGRALEYESKYSLAADVYRTIVAHAHPVDEADIAIPAHVQLGFCLRGLGDLEGSAAAYDEATRVATNVGDLVGVLRAQVGRAQVYIALGNVPQAESVLDDAIVRTAAPGLEDVRARALHERAHVASLRGQYERTIHYAYQALETATSPRHRDRILADIATSFADLGLLEVARDAYLVVAATAQEQYVRWVSEINLLEIVARLGSEPQFDKYRRGLEAEPLVPQAQVLYCLHVGRGYNYLGRSDASVEYLQRAIEVASRYRLNQLLFEAEEALTDARRRASSTKAKYDGPIPDSIREIAEVIGDMKRVAGVI